MHRRNAGILLPGFPCRSQVILPTCPPGHLDFLSASCREISKSPNTSLSAGSTPMTKALPNALGALLLTLGALPNVCQSRPPSHEIRNPLISCLDVVDLGTHPHKARFHLQFLIRPIQPTSECGCKSALAKYTVLEVTDKSQHAVIEGHFDTRESIQLAVPMAAHTDSIHRLHQSLQLSCAHP